MNKTMLYAGIAAGIFTASCSGNATSPLGPNGFIPAQSKAVSAVPGWESTGTRAIALKSFPNGAIPTNTPLRVVVGLYMRDPAGAAALVREQYSAGTASFHKWLTPGQFTAMFNPTRAQASAVADYLRQQGFTDVSIEPNNLIVSATGSVSRAEAAFHTSIRGNVVNGKLVYGNIEPALVPSQFRGVVGAVLGLSNAYQMHVHNIHSNQTRVIPYGVPPPCLQVVNGICIGGEYGPPQYQVAYDAACSLCTTGSATSIAVMAEGNVSQVGPDLRTAEKFWGLPAVPFGVVKVGVSSPDTSGVDEWDLDTQISSGIAQTVKALYVYDTTSLTDSDTALEYSRWVNDNKTQAGNSSFGEPESLAYADGAMFLDDELMNQAAAQGMTMFASTGDNGAGCPVLAATGVPNSGVPEVCYPAASPYVVAVGGTTLDTVAKGNEPGPYYGEHVWIGTGGGVSKWETAPYWQSNGICGPCGPNAMRSIADIAMCADNNGCPMDVFVKGAQTGVGGTSLSSPMSMGLWARLQSHFNNGLGFAAPLYYGIYGRYEPCPLGSKACVPTTEQRTAALPPDTTGVIGSFHDTLFGTNGIPSSAAPGWDIPTGLGSVDYYLMQQDISKSIFSGH